jgi:hypothetical protein
MQEELKEKYEIEIIFTPAMIGGKKNSAVCATNNNVHLWFRHSKTKIKNAFQELLREWYLPCFDENPYHCGEVHFTILRTNGRGMDSDALGISTNKWAIDTLTHQGYIVDDNRIKIVLEPTELNYKSEIETQVRMKIILWERFTMTIEELKESAAKLVKELENVGGDSHIKASSARARKILVDIKNATPQLRRDMIALDK